MPYFHLRQPFFFIYHMSLWNYVYDLIFLLWERSHAGQSRAMRGALKTGVYDKHRSGRLTVTLLSDQNVCSTFAIMKWNYCVFCSLHFLFWHLLGRVWHHYFESLGLSFRVINKYNCYFKKTQHNQFKIRKQIVAPRRKAEMLWRCKVWRKRLALTRAISHCND